MKKKQTVKSKKSIPKKIIKPIINCYTDGSYSYTHDVGGYCAYLECFGRSIMISGSEHQTTNNRMELRAVLEALRIVIVPSVFIIHADSMYVVDGIAKWMHNWVKRKWQTAAGAPVQNADIWSQVYELCKYHTVHTVHVKGHSGVPGNELCDEVSGMHMATLKQYI